MPRKQLLVLGFRHWGQVSKQVQQQKAARLVAIKKLHTGAHKAAAHKAATGPQQSASQLQKGQATRQDTQQPPSFAASAFVGRQPAAQQSSAGVFGRLLNRLRPAAPAHASDALPSAPSFAAAPLVKGQQPQQQREPTAHAAPQPNAALSAARRLAAQASASASATASNPLYRFAKLGSGQPEQRGAGAGAAANKENLGALKQYAELPQKQAATAGGGAVKRAAQRALDAKAMLRYAKLK